MRHVITIPRREISESALLWMMVKPRYAHSIRRSEVKFYPTSSEVYGQAISAEDVSPDDDFMRWIESLDAEYPCLNVDVREPEPDPMEAGGDALVTGLTNVSLVSGGSEVELLDQGGTDARHVRPGVDLRQNDQRSLHGGGDGPCADSEGRPVSLHVVHTLNETVPQPLPLLAHSSNPLG